MNYIPLSQLYSLQIDNLPTKLDCINLTYKGVNFHIHGVLHGLIGGTNQQYRDIINDTISKAPGLKLGEKSMKKMYSGLDYELDDWLQVPLKDVFFLTLNLVRSPNKWYQLGKVIFTEMTTKKDRFGINGINRIQDIGGSMAFHSLNPSDRRRLAGFPEPERYLAENLLRRKHKSFLNAPRFPDPDWIWLNTIEPFANIPCRSIHMIETALAMAQDQNQTEVSLFIGEIHNTDIAWYVQRENTTTDMEKDIKDIVSKAHNYKKINKTIEKLKYLGAAAVAASIPMFVVLTSIICYQQWHH
jgi:hypothetical protein